MNSVKHAEISVKRRGGEVSDYFLIHSFIDSTKELCSDNRHRILHNLWGVRRVVIPIFGHTILNSQGKEINVKDLCEQDHVLPDYNNKFIPTLNDFIDQIEPLTKEEDHLLNEIHEKNKFTNDELDLILSPLKISGEKKSLLITHNSWFINEILPRIMKRKIELVDFPISSKTLFRKMKFTSWMDNGLGDIPNSCKIISDLL